MGGGKPPRFYTGTLSKVNSLKYPLKALPVHRLFHALSDKRNQAFIYNIKKHIFEEAKKGDQICIQAIEEMTDTLGKGIANICYVLNPEIVVLGGGIMAQETFLKDRIKGAVKKYLVSSIEKHTKITFAENQNDAGMLGAFYHFCGMHLKE